MEDNNKKDNNKKDRQKEDDFFCAKSMGFGGYDTDGEKCITVCYSCDPKTQEQRSPSFLKNKVNKG